MTNSSPTQLNGERSPLRQPPSNGRGEQSIRDSEAGDSRANTSLDQSNNGDSRRRLFAMDQTKGVIIKVALDFFILLCGECLSDHH